MSVSSRSKKTPLSIAATRSAEPDAVLLPRVLTKLETESWSLGNRHEPVDDLRPLAEQLEPERIARRVGEGFEDEAGRARRDGVDVDLGIVVGGERHLIELGHDGCLAPDREPASPRRVDDQVVDEAFRHHRAQAEG